MVMVRAKQFSVALFKHLSLLYQRLLQSNKTPNDVTTTAFPIFFRFPAILLASLRFELASQTSRVYNYSPG